MIKFLLKTAIIIIVFSIFKAYIEEVRKIRKNKPKTKINKQINKKD